ncbi:MAG: hypothetical protein EAZ20_00205 [Bacteroidetes bacterium]|nr:MAG: hypothetical protein EAZ20_00205 [Bacteroidota bacterium]
MLRKVDREETKFKISMLIARCCAMLNIEKNMNNEQIKFAAEHFVQHHWKYSLEDIQLCLDRGTAGMYGTIYNRLDLSILNEWILKFEQERDAHIDALRTQERQNNNIYEMFQHPQIMDAMQQAADKLSIKEAPVREVKRENPPPLEIALMREYDALPQWDNNIFFRMYKNKPYQFTEYRQERYRELIENQNEY